MKRKLSLLWLALASFLCLPLHAEELYTGRTLVTSGVIDISNDKLSFHDVDAAAGSRLKVISGALLRTAMGLDAWAGQTRGSLSAESAVTSALITDGTITNADIAAGAAIALSKLATDPLARANHTGTQLLATISDAGTLAGLNAVASAQITDATITNADIAAGAAIALSKLATDPLARSNHTGTQTISTLAQSGATSGQVIKWNGTAWAPAADSTSGGGGGGGDVTAAADFGTDNSIILSDGTGKGVKASGLTVDGSNNLAGVNDIAVSGSISAAGGLEVNGALSTDDTTSGTTLAGLDSGAALTQWQAVYVGSGGTYLLADANGSGTFPVRGLAVADYSSGVDAVIITSGTVRNDSWTWTAGANVYLSTTAGGLTQTVPDAENDVIQCVGWAVSADVLMLTISPDYGTAPAP